MADWGDLWSGIMDFVQKDPRVVPAVLGTGMGIYGMAQNAIQQNQLKNYVKGMQQPLQTDNYYQPISAAEQQARMRAIRADLAARGIPLDSAYATNLIAEQMAMTESQRLQQAYQQAASARGLASGALAMYPQGNMQSAMQGFMSLPNWLAARKKEEAIQDQPGPAYTGSFMQPQGQQPSFGVGGLDTSKLYTQGWDVPYRADTRNLGMESDFSNPSIGAGGFGSTVDY